MRIKYTGPFNHAALDRLGLEAFTLIASTLGISGLGHFRLCLPVSGAAGQPQ
jgi:hypothetical protein